MPLVKLRIPAADLEAARRAEILLRELLTPEPLAVTLFEEKPDGFAVAAYYRDAERLSPTLGALAALGDCLPPVLEEVPDANWLALSQAALPPVRAGRFLVHGRHDRQRIASPIAAIEIEAGEAFGTAHNATTLLCLEAIDELTRRRRFTSALDLGCGTGILAIALARAEPNVRVIASDSDPLAAAIARANVRLNRVARRVRVIKAESFNHAELGEGVAFDLVLANLLPRSLMRLKEGLLRRLRPGGVAVLSGILNHQAREVSAVYRAAGLRQIASLSRDGWTALLVAKSPRSYSSGRCGRGKRP